MKPFYEQAHYSARVIDQGIGETRTNKPQFILRFKVLGKIERDADGDEVVASSGPQYERTMYRVLTEKTMPYFIEDLKALGFCGDSYKMLDRSHPNCHSFIGQDIRVFCRYGQDQNGEPKEEWGIVRQRDAEPIKPAGSATLRQLDALFGKHLKSLKREDSKPEQRPAQDVADDDVPF